VEECRPLCKKKTEINQIHFNKINVIKLNDILRLSQTMLIVADNTVLNKKVMCIRVRGGKRAHAKTGDTTVVQAYQTCR
jgi:hypothetical protein